MSEVFISYVHEDKEKIGGLAKILETNGVGVWLDRERLTPGVRWKIAIAQAIRKGTFFLSIHSKARQQKGVSYVNEELTVAIEEIRKRPINKPWLIPVSLDGSEIDARPIGGGETLQDLQYCDLSEWNSGARRLLETLGVEKPSLQSLDQEDIGQRQKRAFTAPAGTAEDALSALQSISENYGGAKVKRKNAVLEYSRNTIRDLVNLGLLQADFTDETVRLINPDGDHFFALSVAAAREPAFQVAVDILTENLNTSGADIGRAVADALDKNLSKTTVDRYGTSLRRWIFLLYPNLRKPTIGESAYLVKRDINSTTPRKGRPNLLNADKIKEAAEGLPRPITAKAIAERLGVSPMTVGRWKHRNKKRWAELFP